MNRDLTKLHADFKKAEDPAALRKSLSKQLRAELPPLRRNIRMAVREVLPSGMASYYDKAQVRLRLIIKPGKFSARITAGRTAMGGERARAVDLNEGRLRHPVWGHRDRWVDQRVRPGWWDRSVADMRWEGSVYRAVDETLREENL